MAILISDLGPNIISNLKLRGKTAAAPHLINTILRKAVNPKLLITNLAEALTCKPAEAKEILISTGFADLISERYIRQDPIGRFAESVLETAKGKFSEANKTLLKADVPKEFQIKRLDSVLRNALDTKAVVEALAKEFNYTTKKTADILKQSGALEIAATGYSVPKIATSSKRRGETTKFQILGPNDHIEQYLPKITIGFSQTEFDIPVKMVDPLKELFNALPELISADSLPGLYREGIMEYYRKFMAEDAPKVGNFILTNYGQRGPKYVFNSGIGANEQSNHPLAKLNNIKFYYNPDTGVYWIMANSPREFENFLLEHPEIAADMTIDNTLFMEFSRSGKTQETVKLHEFTNRGFKRIVFANEGPLREIGERDGNLCLDLPDDVSGRFGFSRTPILLAPMFVTGMDTEAYWKALDATSKNNDFNNPLSFPSLLAKYIYLAQRSRPYINHIYLGINHPILNASGDTLIQFWMEGVNKISNLGFVNDLSMSRYLGLPRDAHLTLEGILSNYATKIGIFMLYKGDDFDSIHPNMQKLINRYIDPINLEHQGMQLGSENFALAGANAERFIELEIPSILIKVDKITTETLAVLNMLSADTTLAYAKLLGIDPGSNEEVKFVRDRSDGGLISAASGEYVDKLLKLFRT